MEADICSQHRWLISLAPISRIVVGKRRAKIPSAVVRVPAGCRQNSYFEWSNFPFTEKKGRTLAMARERESLAPRRAVPLYRHTSLSTFCPVRVPDTVCVNLSSNRTRGKECRAKRKRWIELSKKLNETRSSLGNKPLWQTFSLRSWEDRRSFDRGETRFLISAISARSCRAT